MSGTTPSREFSGPARGRTEGNSFASFGHEGPAEERAAASEVLEANLRARERHDWADQCKTLSANQARGMAERANFLLGKENLSCAKGLELEAEPVPASVLEDTMTGPIDVLRVAANKAYALFHGTHGKDYGMPMIKENSEWRVDSLITYPLARR